MEGGGRAYEEICSEASGRVTNVMGTEEDISIIFRDGITVISSACSTVKGDSRRAEKLGGGGLHSGGGLGLPNSSLKSLCSSRQ